MLMRTVINERYSPLNWVSFNLGEVGWTQAHVFDMGKLNRALTASNRSGRIAFRKCSQDTARTVSQTRSDESDYQCAGWVYPIESKKFLTDGRRRCSTIVSTSNRLCQWGLNCLTDWQEVREASNPDCKAPIGLLSSGSAASGSHTNMLLPRLTQRANCSILASRRTSQYM